MDPEKIMHEHHKIGEWVVAVQSRRDSGYFLCRNMSMAFIEDEKFVDMYY